MKVKDLQAMLKDEDPNRDVVVDVGLPVVPDTYRVSNRKGDKYARNCATIYGIDCAGFEPILLEL